MNKPASELTALADEAKGILQFAHTEHFSIWQAEAFIEKVELILRRLAVSSDVSVRTAANQSGSERAGVDALREALGNRLDELTDAVNTNRALSARVNGKVILERDKVRAFVLPVLATPPAQPAPACGGPQLCAGGIEPGFDECPKCGATWEDDCKFDTQSSDGGVEGHAERQVTDDLHLAGREKAKRSDERPSMDHHQVGAKVQSGPQSLKVTSAGIKPGPSEAPSTHGKPDGAVREALLSAQAALSDGAFTGPLINDALKKVSVALRSPEIAAAETSPGDVLAMKEACIRICLEEAAEWDSDKVQPYKNYPGQCANRIDRLDVKAEAKSQEPETVAVKPLEWRNGVAGSCTLIADTILGRYAAWYIEPHGVWRSPTASPGILCGNSLDAAKAAAQADYEQRIRSALIHPTKPEAPAVSVDAIARIIDPVTFAKFDAEIQKDRKAQNICADSFFEYRNVRCRNVFVGLSISSESNGLLTSGSIGNRPGFKNVDLFAVGI